ncbi:hypothetical protein AWENTII_008203 [Aspergillus wentii]
MYRAIHRLFCRLPSLISNAFTRSAWTEDRYTEKLGKIPYKDVSKWWPQLSVLKQIPESASTSSARFLFLGSILANINFPGYSYVAQSKP